MFAICIGISTSTDKHRPADKFFHWIQQGVPIRIEVGPRDVKKQSAIGERSSSYLYHKESAKRISQNLPNIKLIFVLRNPIERTWANYRYTVLSGLVTL